jgi:hypothetical protein
MRKAEEEHMSRRLSAFRLPLSTFASRSDLQKRNSTMKRFAFAVLGVLAVTLSSGCCGWLWPCGYSSGYPYRGYGYPSTGCPTGNCGVAPGTQYVPPHTSHYRSYDSVQSVQMGVPETIDGPVTYLPAGYPTVAIPAVPELAVAPLDSLPTY